MCVYAWPKSSRARTIVVYPRVRGRGRTGVRGTITTMPKQRRAHCRDCGTSGNDAPISKTGYCPACGEARLLSNISALQNKRGPEFETWALGYARYVTALVALSQDDTDALNPEGHSPGSASAGQP